MGYFVIGIAVMFNIIVIKIKFEKQRYADALLDALVLGVLTMVFKGGYATLVIGTIASAGVSIYLMIFPPKLPKFIGNTKKLKRLKRKLVK